MWEVKNMKRKTMKINKEMIVNNPLNDWDVKQCVAPTEKTNKERLMVTLIIWEE